jgi:hypothetical protein
MLAESLRNIRSNLAFINKNAQTIVISSSISGEGKTFIALNLAGIIAMSGKKTIVLDLDLRKPKVHLGFNATNDQGMSNLIVNQITLEEAIQKSLLESIKRTSIVAQNRGFSKEISALLKHVNTLNLLIQTINVQIATIETKTKIEGDARAFAAEKNGIVLNSILVVYWDGFTSDVTQPKFYGWGYNDDRRMDWGNSHGRLYFKNFDKESVKVNLSATFNKTKNTPNVNGFINLGPKWFEFGEKSNKFFLNLIRSRQNQKLIGKIRNDTKEFVGQDQVSKGITEL